MPLGTRRRRTPRHRWKQGKNPTFAHTVSPCALCGGPSLLFTKESTEDTEHFHNNDNNDNNDSNAQESLSPSLPSLSSL